MYKSVTLQCSAININKTLSSLTYQWQKNTNDIKGACSNTYQTNEPGVYRCKISNKYTTVYTQDAILTLEPVNPTGDYFIAKTARGNKTGRGSWDNATDDIKTFDYDGDGEIELGNTYVETGKVCDVGGNYLDFNGNVIGGCEVGSFVPSLIMIEVIFIILVVVLKVLTLEMYLQ